MATSALIAKLPFPKDVQNIIMDKVNAFDDLLVCGLNMKKEVIFYAHRNVHKPNATFVKVDKRTGKETAASFQTMAKMRVLCPTNVDYLCILYFEGLSKPPMMKFDEWLCENDDSDEEDEIYILNPKKANKYDKYNVQIIQMQDDEMIGISAASLLDMVSMSDYKSWNDIIYK